MSTPEAPAGEVTLMFTDIEGSTRSWDTYQERFHAVLERHNALLRSAIACHGGYEVKTIGDSFMVAFDSPRSAALCALEMQRVIEGETFPEIGELRIRIGMHLGELVPYDGDYFGPPVNRAARIESAAHGGQILLSEEVARRIETALPADARLIEHGYHRLKDLGAAIPLYELTQEALPRRDYPRLRTLDVLPHNFPAQSTTFIGREEETRSLLHLIIQQKVRLITLLGPGGTGKTRLSMQVAADCVENFPDGVWIVELASVTDPQEVPVAVAMALGIKLSPQSSVQFQVADFLRDRACLLILDNFEQIIEAAPFVGDLMKQCRKVTMLVSSRYLLQISGEQEFPLEPLSAPPADAEPETLRTYPSVQLFDERARAVRPAFELNAENLPIVAEICRRLDGLPLAIELTAALMRGLTASQILPRLQDRFKLLASTRRDLEPRQRTLRGAIDWSYDLLDAEERAFFEECSVFVNGFTEEAAAEITEKSDAFSLIFAMRDKSLLKTQEVGAEMRYYMLETLREYALEKLEMRPDADALRQRHTAYYLQLAETLTEQLERSPDAKEQMKRDFDNMRAGMDRALHQDNLNAVSSFGRALYGFLSAQNWYSEGVRRLTMGEEAARRAGDQPALAKLRLQHGVIAWKHSDIPEAERGFQDSYEISKALDDQPRMIPALVNLGLIAWSRSDLPAARRRWEEALPLARETRQPRYEAVLLANLGLLASDAGDFDDATRFFDEAMALHQREKNLKLYADALMNSAEVARRKGDPETALSRLEESHRLFVSLEQRHEVALTLIRTGQVFLEAARPDEAEDFLDRGLVIAQEIEDNWCKMFGLTQRGRLEGVRGNLGRAWEQYRLAYAIASKLEGRQHQADIARHAGCTLADAGCTVAGYQLLSLAYREFAALNLFDRYEVARHCAALREKISPDVLADSESKCLSMSMIFERTLPLNAV